MPFTKILVNEAKDSNKFIKDTIKAMKQEFDKYIREMEDMPWWYNERALLGFYVSGLLRNKDNFVLQEYSCTKGRKANKKGRADILFKCGDDLYIAEAKLYWSSLNTKSGFKEAEKWAKSVLIQANKYAMNEKGTIKKKNVFSLCFEVIYCSKTSYDNYAYLIKNWMDKEKEALHFLDFYSLIHLQTNIIKQSKFHNYYYPALAIYGRFKK